MYISIHDLITLRKFIYIHVSQVCIHFKSYLVPVIKPINFAEGIY